MFPLIIIIIIIMGLESVSASEDVIGDLLVAGQVSKKWHRKQRVSDSIIGVLYLLLLIFFLIFVRADGVVA